MTSLPKTKLPDLKTRKQLAHFWDTHDLTDYLGELRFIQGEYKPGDDPTEVLSLRIPASLKRRVQDLAKQAHISSSDLIRIWMFEKVVRR